MNFRKKLELFIKFIFFYQHIEQGTNFVRCIKPNSRMQKHVFEGDFVLSQLNNSGTTSVLELMEYGYPSRVPFADLYNMYKQFLPPELETLEPKIFCKAMLHSQKLNNKDFKFGTTSVFFRPGKFVEFDRIMKSHPENLKAVVADVLEWLKLTRALCAQKLVRGFFARKQHRPRYRGIIKIKSLIEKLHRTTAGDTTAPQQSNATLEDAIKDCVKIIQNDDRISAKSIETMYTEMMEKIDQHNEMMMMMQKKVIALPSKQLARSSSDAILPKLSVGHGDDDDDDDHAHSSSVATRNLHLQSTIFGSTVGAIAEKCNSVCLNLISNEENINFFFL